MEKMGKEELRNPNLVVAWLKQGLGESDGRWLLCLQNADDSKVNGILNEVCGIAGEAKEKGWVVVTLRQGRPHIQGVQKKTADFEWAIILFKGTRTICSALL